MKSEIKEGDLVQLRSGGPVMTVGQVDAEREFLTCQWFDGKELKVGKFTPASLEVHEED
ncbi:YodC family protein [Paraliomyxa miuraensis]|uniref:YodC family protein n=1 Tax=Paraliomyxa miuraensis TaxID=376150 RepID=UPI00225C015D|nr:DUF2158 domain-containing protein [Paraliomyxa miuraensis]MCX4247751.1 YodC family protein [Paraliomyxa miuraensis]